MLMAMRHALAKYPDCKYIWFLDQDAYIMEQRQSIDEVVMASSKLESLMIKDQPVVPPDSIIKTYGHLRGNDIDVVVAQDRTGLVHNNLIIRNGEWAKFFLETWMDPLYRSYNFQKAERHALVSATSPCEEGTKANLVRRNILFSGTRRSSRSLLSCPSARLPRTPRLPWARSSKPVTLWPCSPAAPRSAKTAART